MAAAAHVVQLGQDTLTLAYPSLQTLVDAVRQIQRSSEQQALVVDGGNFRLRGGHVSGLAYVHRLGSSVRPRHTASLEREWRLEGKQASNLMLQNGVLDWNEDGQHCCAALVIAGAQHVVLRNVSELVCLCCRTW